MPVPLEVPRVRWFGLASLQQQSHQKEQQEEQQSARPRPRLNVVRMRASSCISNWRKSGNIVDPTMKTACLFANIDRKNVSPYTTSGFGGRSWRSLPFDHTLSEFVICGHLTWNIGSTTVVLPNMVDDRDLSIDYDDYGTANGCLS